MDKNTLNETFLEMLQDLYYAENKIVKSLPLMIEAAAYHELKQSFKKHLKETKGQVSRLEKIFHLLGKDPSEKKCYGIHGLVKECKEIIEKDDLTSAFKDACLILAAQKIEHYEIATYGSLCALIKHMAIAVKDQKQIFNKILDLLQETLVEEKQTDLLLTQLAEGTRSMQGINEEAEKEIFSCCQS